MYTETLTEDQRKGLMETSPPCVFGRQLGEGVEAVVRLATIPSSNIQLACKTVSKVNPDALRHIQTEISVLEQLKGHQNIVSTYGHFEDSENIHILLELCEGGDLCDFIQINGPLSEPQASMAISAIAKAVSFCHSLGIAHRDLKAENILFPRLNSPLSQLKLADFGTAANFFEQRSFSDVEGTPWYLAPEIFNRNYDEKVDVWSLGVLLHIMLSGYPPFDGETIPEIFQEIKRGRLDLRRDPWTCISKEAKDLLKGMLQKNPYRRMKLHDVLLHPWLQNLSTEADPQVWMDKLHHRDSLPMPIH